MERRRELIDTGLDRLRAALQDNDHLTLAQMCDALVRSMAPPGGFSDDVAMLALRTCGVTPQRLVDAFPSTPPQLGPARQRFAGWLRTAGYGGAFAGDAVLAYAEAIANASEHGNKNNAERTVGVEAIRLDGVLTVAVADGGRWDEDSTRSRRADRGRGFTILHALTTDLQVHQHRLGTTVRFEIPLPPAVRPDG